MDLFRSFFERQPEPLPDPQSSRTSEGLSPPGAKSPLDTTELAFRDRIPPTQRDALNEACDNANDLTQHLLAGQAPKQHLDQPTDRAPQEPFPLGKLQADYPVVTPAKRGPSQSASPAPLAGLENAPKQHNYDEPVPFCHPSSPENVSLMHQLFISRCVKPELYFSQVVDQFTWACKLTFDLPFSIAQTASIPDHQVGNSAGNRREVWESFDPSSNRWTITVQDLNPYPTKKVAKEQVAEMAIPILQLLPHPSKRSPQASTEPEENWIGRLLEYCNATDIPQARYQEFKAGQGFACELSMQARPDFVFGGRDKTFPNKKSAKASAAREAITWLRQTDRMAEMEGRRSRRSLKKGADAHDAKRQKTASSPPCQIKGIGPVKPAVLSPASALSEDKSEPRTAEDLAGDQERGSYTKKVMALCAALHMKVPVYHTRPNPRAPSLFSVTATFAFPRDLASLHLFQILPKDQTGVSVNDVKVRSAALDQCAQRVYELLLDLQHSLRAAELAGLRITAPPPESQLEESSGGLTAEQQQALAVSTVA